MAIKLASEHTVKTSTEVKKINMQFERELGSSETISSVSSTVVSPAGELTANSTESGTIVQVTASSGLAPVSFTADASTDTFTSTSHGLSANHPVHVYADGADNVPTGITAEDDPSVDDGTQYYVVNPAANTFQLALTSGGTAINLTSDGQGKVGVDYTVTVTVVTSNSQTVVGQGLCKLRD